MNSLGPPAAGAASGGPSGRKKSKAEGPATAAEKKELTPEQVRVYDEAKDMLPSHMGSLLAPRQSFRYRRVCRQWHAILPLHVRELPARAVCRLTTKTLQSMARSKVVRLRRVELPWSEGWSGPKTEAAMQLVNKQASERYLKELRISSDIDMPNWRGPSAAQQAALNTLDPQALPAGCILEIDLTMLRLITNNGSPDRVLTNVSDVYVFGGNKANFQRSDIPAFKQLLATCLPGLRRLCVDLPHGELLADVPGVTHFGFVVGGRNFTEVLKALGTKVMLGAPVDVHPSRLSELAEKFSPIKPGPDLQVLCLLRAHVANLRSRFCWASDLPGPNDFLLVAVSPADYSAFLNKHPSLRLLAIGSPSKLPYPLPDPAADPATAARLVHFPQGHEPYLVWDRSLKPITRTVCSAPGLCLAQAATLGPDATRLCLETILRPLQTAPGPVPPPSGPGSAERQRDLAWVERVAETLLRSPLLAVCRSTSDKPWDSCIRPLTGGEGVLGECVTDIYADIWIPPPQSGPSLLLKNLQRVHLVTGGGGMHSIGVLNLRDAAPGPAPPAQAAGQRSLNGFTDSRFQDEFAHSHQDGQRFLEAFLHAQGKAMASLEEVSITSKAHAAGLANAGLLKHIRSLDLGVTSGVTALLPHGEQLTALEALVLSGNSASKPKGAEIRALLRAVPRLASVRAEGMGKAAVNTVKAAVESLGGGVAFGSDLPVAFGSDLPVARVAPQQEDEGEQ